MLRRLKILVGLLVVFIAGAAVGGVAVARGVQKKVAEKADSSKWEPSTMAWLRKDLGLTAEQEEKVRPIVHESMEEMKSFRDRVEAERKTITWGMMVRVSEELTPGQREKLRGVTERGKRVSATNR